MRQKMITLDPTSWEIASKMKNFSGWVRQQLKEIDESEKKVNALSYESVCDPCDIFYLSNSEYAAKYNYCQKCHHRCKYIGVSEMVE
jgi:hypothetical protein